MDGLLVDFMSADDLDALSDARGHIASITKQDAAEITGIVESWGDMQALANLLMYPEVIPSPVRRSTLLRGLYARDEEAYFVLAAILGVQRLGAHDEIPEDLRIEIAGRLLELATSSSSVIAGRASLALEEFVDDVGVDTLLTLLETSDETVFHNLCAIALRHSGREAVIETLEHLAETDRIDSTVALQAKEHVEQLRGMRELPLLVYIPNLDEWRALP